MKQELFQVPLACDADMDNLDALPYPLAMLIKYDGVRVVHINGCYGRSMKLHRNPYLQSIFNKPEYYGFDSEGIVGDPLAPNCISVSSGGFSRGRDKPKENKFIKVDAVCYVFDDFSVDGGFEERHASATRRVEALLEADPTHQICIVPYIIVKNKEELLALEEKWVPLGHEGMIGRTLNGIYKNGRCTKRESYFLRFKRFEEREGTIEDYEEGSNNQNEAEVDELGHTKRSTKAEGMVPNGQISALWVRDLKSKERVKISAGRMTVAEATDYFNNFWKIKGKISKYKVFAKGTGNFTKPRQPTHQCIRSPEDM
jgi:hypothetical protein